MGFDRTSFSDWSSLDIAIGLLLWAQFLTPPDLSVHYPAMTDHEDGATRKVFFSHARSFNNVLERN
jgi:hypothetical protein